MNSLKERIWSIVEDHSLKNPITGREISLLVGADQRTVRAAVRELTLEGKPIGASSEPPWGFYRIENPEELKSYYGRLVNRGIKILERAAKLKRQAMPEFLLQLSFELEDQK